MATISTEISRCLMDMSIVLFAPPMQALYEEKHILSLADDDEEDDDEESDRDEEEDDRRLVDTADGSASRQPKGGGGLSKADEDCFSSVATIMETKGKGVVTMKDVRIIGNKVLTPSVSFEPVYGWAHINHHTQTEFLKIVTDQGSSALELTTTAHYVYLVGVTHSVTAGRVKIGDTLVAGANKTTRRATAATIRSSRFKRFGTLDCFSIWYVCFHSSLILESTGTRTVPGTVFIIISSSCECRVVTLARVHFLYSALMT